MDLFIICLLFFRLQKLRFRFLRSPMATVRTYHVVATLATADPKSTALTLCVVPDEWFHKRNVVAYPTIYNRRFIDNLIVTALPPEKHWPLFACAPLAKFKSSTEAKAYVAEHESDESDNDAARIVTLQRLQQHLSDAAVTEKQGISIPLWKMNYIYDVIYSSLLI